MGVSSYNHILPINPPAVYNQLCARGIQPAPRRRFTIMKKLIAVLILILAAASVALAADSPKAAVTGLYNTYIKLKTRGIPSAKELTQYKPYITPELAGLLKSAGDAEIKYKEDTKGEVPPLVEGDIFTSLFEGADSYKILSCDEKSDSAACLLEFKNKNPGDGKTFTWKDGVMLVKGKSGWLVSDVEYKGDWEFAVKGKLSEMLKSVISGDYGD